MSAFDIRAIAPAAALAALLAAQPFAAGAQDLASSFPRVIESGENSVIDYGPAGSTNVFGGGALTSKPGNEQPVVTYLDPSFAQDSHDGLVSVTTGSGESEQLVWVPANTDPRAAELVGPDGRVPNLATVGRQSPRG